MLRDFYTTLAHAPAILLLAFLWDSAYVPLPPPPTGTGGKNRRSERPTRMSRTTTFAVSNKPGRSQPGVICPDCGSASRDPVEAQFGYCPRCREFTGLCGAGRKVVCPDIMTKTSWHIPCTRTGEVAWEIAVHQNSCVTLLCRWHDAQVRTGAATWIKHARRLAGLADPGPSPIRGIII